MRKLGVLIIVFAFLSSSSLISADTLNAPTSSLSLLSFFPQTIQLKSPRQFAQVPVTDTLSVDRKMNIAVIQTAHSVDKPMPSTQQAFGNERTSISAPHETAPTSNEEIQTMASQSAPDEPVWLEEGQFIELQRKSPQALQVGDKMRFIATLNNSTESKWNLIAEVIVRKGDGSQETLIPNYTLRLNTGKQMKVPVAMAVKEKRFPPGLTQFIAFLRDPQGHVIDRASITFVITMPLP